MVWTETTREHYDRQGLRYSSDCSDKEWEIIEPFLQARNGLGRLLRHDYGIYGMLSIIQLRRVASGGFCRKSFHPLQQFNIIFIVGGNWACLNVSMMLL